MLVSRADGFQLAAARAVRRHRDRRGGAGGARRVGRTVALTPVNWRTWPAELPRRLPPLLESAYPPTRAGSRPWPGRSAARRCCSTARAERPWVRDARLDVDDAGQPTPPASTRTWPRPTSQTRTTAVVELLAVPGRARTRCRGRCLPSVDATGNTAGLCFRSPTRNRPPQPAEPAESPGTAPAAARPWPRSPPPPKPSTTSGRPRDRRQARASSFVAPAMPGRAVSRRRASSSRTPSLSPSSRSGCDRRRSDRGRRARSTRARQPLVDPASFLGTMICNQLFVRPV